jgi:integrase/recombinase XerD
METLDWQVAQMRARDMEASGPESRQTVAAACDAFEADAKARGLKEESIDKYRTLFRQLKAFAEQQNIVQLSGMTLEVTRRFRESWTNKGQSARKKLEFLRSFFRFCVDSGWMRVNTAKLIKLPIATSAPVLPFTAKEIEAILAACDKYRNKRNRIRLRALVWLMMTSGLRLGDAVSLPRDAIKAGRLHLRTAKTGTDVSIPLPPETLAALAAIPRESIYYFWTGKSKKTTLVKDWDFVLRKLFILSGVTGGHSHRLRHTFSVNLLQAGVSIESVAALLGHRSIRITERHYAPWVQERQNKLELDVKKAWHTHGTRSSLASKTT